MDNIKKVELPDELMPDEQMRDNARKIDEAYNDMFVFLRGAEPDLKATEIISIMAQYFVERVALTIGEELNEYDKKILRGVLERHIVEVVFVE